MHHCVLSLLLGIIAFCPTASSAVTLERVIDVVASDTGLDLKKQFPTEAEGLQHLYLHLLRAVHARDALPYQSGDTWGSLRGEALDRLALRLFLKRTSRYLKVKSRCDDLIYVSCDLNLFREKQSIRMFQVLGVGRELHRQGDILNHVCREVVLRVYQR